MGMGKKNGLWENLYSPFRFGEKKCLREKGEKNDKFGKYIPLVKNEEKNEKCMKCLE